MHALYRRFGALAIHSRSLRPSTFGLLNSRNMSIAKGENLVVKKVIYETNGAPNDVLKIKTETLHDPVSTLGSKGVIVKVVASSLNPADFNMIEGTYGTKPKLPADAGSEGVGIIEAAGPESGLSVGDWVIPVTAGLGMWASHVVTPASAGGADKWFPVPSSLSIGDAATLMVNPCTAYRMLSDFVKLKRGDIVVQNGATSGVGTAMIQIAKARGFRTINLVRDRPDMDETRARLTNLGATVVLSESEAADKVLRQSLLEKAGIDSKEQALLGLNCVSGTSTLNLARFIAPKGTIVTYGGMSRKPVMMGVGQFIFQDVTLKGFWMTRWGQEHGRHDEQRAKMMNELIGLMLTDQLKTTTQVQVVQSHDDLKKAVEYAQSSHKPGKSLISFWSDWETSIAK